VVTALAANADADDGAALAPLLMPHLRLGDPRAEAVAKFAADWAAAMPGSSSA